MDRDRAAPQVTELPGEKARERVDYHRSFAAPSTYVYDFVWDHTAPADGPFCTDVDGNVLLDFTSHVGAAPPGYDNPKLTEPMAGSDSPEPAKIAGLDLSVSAGDPADTAFPGPAELMRRPVDATGQYGMDTVFGSNSGVEATTAVACRHSRSPDRTLHQGRAGVCHVSAEVSLPCFTSLCRMATHDSGMEFVLDRDNTYDALPGTMMAVSCPSCFNQQLLKDLIDTGTCRSCDADLELTLSVRPD